VVGKVGFISSWGGSIYAFDTKTGTPLWTTKPGGLIRASPTIVDGLLYTSTDAGAFLALNVSNGDVVWRMAVPNAGGLQSSAASCHGCDVLFGTGADGADSAFLYSVHATTGTTNWKYSMPGGVFASPVIVGNNTKAMVICSSLRGVITALDMKGNRIWEVSTGERMSMSSPAAHDGLDLVVFGGGEGGLYALSLESGTLLWKAKLGGAIFTSPTIVASELQGSKQEYVLVGTMGHDGGLFAFDIHGKKIWENRDVGGSVLSSPTLVAGLLYLGGTDGRVFAVQLHDGAHVWDFNVTATAPAPGECDAPPGDVAVWSSPAVEDGLVWVGSRNCHVYALGLGSGDEHTSATII